MIGGYGTGRIYLMLIEVARRQHRLMDTQRKRATPSRRLENAPQRLGAKIRWKHPVWAA
jgi:hypothetical protein